MESSISSLTFKGCISEAISEAKEKKKLFLVYISGGDDESSTMIEQSMWLDANVVESISRKCVFLHLLQGTVDASNFSAIYPQKSVPNISAIGYNGGKLLWQLEGQVSAENLVAAIEKSCASLQLQETAATVLSAALAAKRPISSSDDASTAPCSSVDKAHQGSGAHLSHTSEADAKTSSEVEQMTSSQSNTTMHLQSHDEELVSTVKPPTQSVSPDRIDVGKQDSRTCIDESTEVQEGVTLEDSGPSGELSFESAEKNGKITQDEVEENVQDQHLKFVKSNDVHLNIRLPNGSTLQVKFLMTDTLRMVKDYVDENQTSAIGPYDLAIPYPRRVFTTQDMSKTLSELGLVNREALIVVPHRSVSESYKGKQEHYERSSTQDSSDGYGGYFGYAKRMLSFLNPFSYVGGGASPAGSESAPNDGPWQYRPNPALQNSLSGVDRSSRPYSALGESSSQGRKATTRQFASNIHTLRHDEDDNRPSDRNTFWNGNSTQYGGDNK
ncbi:plant UBX domain-containing protein 11 [Aristolochia californica]|uniref:plant UBX domain-containing protein 11 n=1 Tax=Aristolochia californica TaxID=171875 RepID=UPI0035DE3784